ncbi:hypothetical protein AC1031_011649 [Aphanomyces cochlioides]|nr:hypothetical protein AC1031_011649 [Aphanomyces cochlioides]
MYVTFLSLDSQREITSRRSSPLVAVSDMKGLSNGAQRVVGEGEQGGRDGKGEENTNDEDGKSKMDPSHARAMSSTKHRKGQRSKSNRAIAMSYREKYKVVRAMGSKYETSGRRIDGKIGGAAGGAAGGALGTAVAGPVGTAFGKSVGSSLGATGGAAAGQRAGTWMDGKIGRQVDKYKARKGTGKCRV